MAKLIVFGYSKSGRDLAKELILYEYEVIILETNKERYEEAQKDGFDAYLNKNIDDELLVSLGIGYSIEALFCMSKNNSENLFVAHSARYLSKEIKILSVVSNPNDEKRMLLAGVNRTLNPFSIGAMLVYKLLDKDHILKIFENILMKQTDLRIEHIQVPDGSFLDKTALKDVNFRKYTNVVLIGFIDVNDGVEEFVFWVKGLNQIIDAGESVVVLGKDEDIKEFRELLKKKELK